MKLQNLTKGISLGDGPSVAIGMVKGEVQSVEGGFVGPFDQR